jgi:hypothetical protein
MKNETYDEASGAGGGFPERKKHGCFLPQPSRDGFTGGPENPLLLPAPEHDVPHKFKGREP